MPLRRKRASRACARCHARKVRCDATTFGSPCTRCRQDDQTCVMLELPPRAPGPCVPKARSLGSPTSDFCSMHLRAEPADTSTKKRADYSMLNFEKKNYDCFLSYHFLEMKGLSEMTSEEQAFLSSKGCLHLPARYLADEFIQQYFLNCHPSTPIIDEAQFWKVYSNSQDKDTPKVPLLFFQAMLFSSSPYVSREVAQACGFADGKAAWDAFYKSAKILFHFTSGDGSLVRAQVALLLSFFSSAEEPLAASLWLTHAIQYGTIAHTQRSSPTSNDTIIMEDAAHRRLWWCILLRDRSLSLCLRRQAQVSSFEMQMIEDHPTEKYFEAEIHGSRVYDSKTKRMLFKVFQEQCQLAALLTEMVSLTLGTHGISLSNLTRESVQDTYLLVNRVETSLTLWEKASYSSSSLLKDVHVAVTKGIKLTMVHYQAARITLAHYKAFLVEKYSDSFGNDYFYHLSRIGSMLVDAMTQMICIMQYFSKTGQIESLPLTLLGHVTLPLILSAIDFKLSPSESERASRRRTFQCLGEVVAHSRRVYEVGDYICSQTDIILHLAYLTSREIFLQRSSDGPSGKITDCITQESTQIPIDNLDNGRTTQRSGPAKSWLDAFLRYPRAYLLISSTVDYFMSVGRLPQDDSLPDLVRLISPMGRIRLPWTSNKPHTGRDWERKQPEKTSKNQGSPSIWSSEPTMEAEHQILLSNLSSPSHQGLQDWIGEIIDYFAIDIRQTTSPRNDQINLDYLSIFTP